MRPLRVPKILRLYPDHVHIYRQMRMGISNELSNTRSMKLYFFGQCHCGHNRVDPDHILVQEILDHNRGSTFGVHNDYRWFVERFYQEERNV